MGAVWMYRKGEAKLFASPEDVPSGEGWVDSPAALSDVALIEPEAAPVDEAADVDAPPANVPVKRRGRPPKPVETPEEPVDDGDGN